MAAGPRLDRKWAIRPPCRLAERVGVARARYNRAGNVRCCID